jgi:hypothetical protein
MDTGTLSAEAQIRQTVNQVRAANEKAHDQRIEACGNAAAEVTALTELGLLNNAPEVEAAPKAKRAEKKLRAAAARIAGQSARCTRERTADSNPTPSASRPSRDILFAALHAGRNPAERGLFRPFVRTTRGGR